MREDRRRRRDADGDGVDLDTRLRPPRAGPSRRRDRCRRRGPPTRRRRAGRRTAGPRVRPRATRAARCSRWRRPRSVTASGEAAAAAFAEGHALDLDPAVGRRGRGDRVGSALRVGRRRVGQPEIEARALRRTHLRSDRGVGGEGREGARLERPPDDVVRPRGVEADQTGPTRIISRVWRSLRRGSSWVEQRTSARASGPEHAAGIRAVDRDLAAVRQQRRPRKSACSAAPVALRGALRWEARRETRWPLTGGAHRQAARSRPVSPV